MKIKLYPNAELYLIENEAFLLKEEAMNSLLLGLTLSNRKNEADETLYLDIRDHDGIQFTGIKTKNKNLIINGNNLKLGQITPLLVEYLNQNQIKIPGLIGPKELVLNMANILEVEFEWKYKVSFEQLVYKLTKVKSNPDVDGNINKGSMSNIEKYGEWLNLFSIEALNENNVLGSMAIAKTKISSGELFIWHNDLEVSMSCIARPTINGITINYVYTPEQYRRKGYGTKLVAELSNLMLEQGYKFCTLFTDMNNPTSNSIYTKIGYEPVGEFRSIQFV